MLTLDSCWHGGMFVDESPRGTGGCHRDMLFDPISSAKSPSSSVNKIREFVDSFENAFVARV